MINYKHLHISAFDSQHISIKTVQLHTGASTIASQEETMYSNLLGGTVQSGRERT